VDNGERAMVNLRTAGELSADRIRAPGDLEQLVRPSGYFGQKTKRLKDIVAFVDERHGGSLDAMLSTPTLQLRQDLLAQRGSVQKRRTRFFSMRGLIRYLSWTLTRDACWSAKAKYDEVRELVEDALSTDRRRPRDSTAGLTALRCTSRL
jgi:endonuclease III-like uncharacterized protein